MLGAFQPCIHSVFPLSLASNFCLSGAASCSAFDRTSPVQLSLKVVHMFICSSFQFLLGNSFVSLLAGNHLDCPHIVMKIVSTELNIGAFHLIVLG